MPVTISCARTTPIGPSMPPSSGLAGNRQLDLALEPILLKLQRPMAVNLRREAQLHRTRRPASSATNAWSLRWRATIPTPILTELESHGTRRS